mmetsp:Transcript_20614/g.28938  ORF Transcript_20614/g.28938 Transcript_20614/m.28938 type:complete len:118 (+) Transcript_20614:57-410(+)
MYFRSDKRCLDWRYPNYISTNSTNGYAYLDRAPFFMMTHDFEVVFEAENYMFLNYRNQSSYTTGMNGAAWEVVTNLEYTNIIDKGLRCWPNVGRSISSGSIAGPASIRERYHVQWLH